MSISSLKVVESGQFVPYKDFPARLAVYCLSFISLTDLLTKVSRVSTTWNQYSLQHRAQDRLNLKRLFSLALRGEVRVCQPLALPPSQGHIPISPTVDFIGRGFLGASYWYNEQYALFPDGQVKPMFMSESKVMSGYRYCGTIDDLAFYRNPASHAITLLNTETREYQEIDCSFISTWNEGQNHLIIRECIPISKAELVVVIGKRPESGLSQVFKINIQTQSKELLLKGFLYKLHKGGDKIYCQRICNKNWAYLSGISGEELQKFQKAAETVDVINLPHYEVTKADCSVIPQEGYPLCGNYRITFDGTNVKLYESQRFIKIIAERNSRIDLIKIFFDRTCLIIQAMENKHYICHLSTGSVLPINVALGDIVAGAKLSSDLKSMYYLRRVDQHIEYCILQEPEAKAAAILT